MVVVFIISVIVLIAILVHRTKQEHAYRQQRRMLKEYFAEQDKRQSKADEPAPPRNTKNKYTIYSIDEAPAMAKRVLEDMPSDIFSLELISLKQNVIKLFERCKHEFVPGDDARFHVYKVLYSKTYDLLLCDECYFMGDFTPNGRAIYRLCTYCLDESRRLGYVDDDLYKAQKNNISINVRNGKSFS